MTSPQVDISKIRICCCFLPVEETKLAVRCPRCNGLPQNDEKRRAIELREASECTTPAP